MADNASTTGIDWVDYNIRSDGTGDGYLQNIKYKIYNDKSYNNYYIDQGTGTAATSYHQLLNYIQPQYFKPDKWSYDLAHKEYEFFANSGTANDTVTYRWARDGEYTTWAEPVVVAPGDRLRQIIRDRMAPAIRVRRSLEIPMDVREIRARETLKRIIGDKAFRRFIRDGFITVVPKSGLTYRIYPGHGITEVYDRGIMVERLCVVLQGSFPPTDSLIMRYLLILNDEGEFSKYAIKHSVRSSKSLVFPAEEVQPLVETWAKLKVA